MKKCLFFLLFLTTSVLAREYRVNDLAFVYPLKLSKNNYLPIEDLVDSQYLQDLSPRLSDDLNRTYLVGVKLAPCFKELNGTECMHQVRLVFQGSFRDYEDSESTIPFNDNAIHVLINLPKSTFYWFLKVLKYKNGRNDSWVHNFVRDDSRAEIFNSILKRTLKQGNIHLITAMEGDGVFLWNFFKVYPTRTDFNTIDIFKITGEGVNDLSLTEADCLRVSNRKCDEEVESITRKIKKITSAKTHVDEVDCASCHIVEALKAELNFARQDYAQYIKDFDTKMYYKDHVATKRPRSPSNMRNLGYFVKTLSVSQRTINEVKAQLEYLQ
ncbi:MAG: hypothetical protein H6621_05475 [Halobacteriovoraceae bacterium]|nr:hypothetical protein [Halobacteriovoraceae bacterium]